MTGISAPIFRFTDGLHLTNHDSYTRPVSIDGMLAMTGPSVKADPRYLPLRGDLAHIKLAGRCFVPHYAVPVPYSAHAGARLVSAPGVDGEVLAELAAGEVFNVLDIAGAWAWGQRGEEGLVGYVALAEIAAPQTGA
ncbi:SH3 domain-containing protein [Novosphingobium sp. 1949]|uniref:SH3 domain-containing protein n=1 Tax=Novosphingobium organovorum TaxID=2930092 RepID=A0ABT0BHW0_9SPHN|nr:SH3 domain-containing protein [Novosphingobium organovorum]MCJ2184553.1 SH3 domain-containing protein [Novosphingobium organovorum]